MFNKFLLKNINLLSIIVFFILFAIILLSKPLFIFDKNGLPREFGIGYKNKTILPLWLTVIILAIISHLFILYLIKFYRFSF